MNVNCKCGGVFRRSDIIRDWAASAKYGREMYRDSDPTTAHWRCNRCGAIRTQGKRQPMTITEVYNRKRRQHTHKEERK